MSEAIKKVPARLLLCCLGMQLVTEMLLSYQWHRIARTLKLPGTYASHLWANSVESFFDAITPGAKIGGELMRVIFFKEELGYSNIEAVSLLTIQKSFSVSSFLILAAVSACSILMHIASSDSLASYAFIVVLAVAMLFLILYFFLNSEKIYRRLSARESKGKIAQAFIDWLKNFNEHIEKIKSDRRELVAQILISFAIWFIYPLKLFILVSYFKQVNFFYLLAVVFTSYFLGNIPILPGGLVAFEGSMTVLLGSLFLIPYESGAALALIFRFVTYWFVILISMGGVLLWKSRKFIQRIRN